MAAKFDEETSQFLQELKNQAAESGSNQGGSTSNTWTDHDGTTYEWDQEKQGWFPKVDEDFLAAYQMNYGYIAPSDKDTEKATSAENTSTIDTRLPQPVAGADKVGTSHDGVLEEGNKSDLKDKETEEKGKKRKAKEEPIWFEMDQSKNTNVYVSGLPLDIKEDEFVELMLKYGIVMEDSDTSKQKSTTAKVESVALAIDLLDETEYRGSTLHVELAEFNLKGTFNPSLKKKKKKKKKKPGKGQDRLLDWVDRDHKRPKNERVVVIRNMFDVNEFEKEPPLILEMRNDLRKECEKYGDVRKVIVFDRNKEGICSVAFREHESADACITVMNGRWFAGRRLEASKWDGSSNFNIQETDKDLEDRMKNWEKYLYGEEDEVKHNNRKILPSLICQ
ncbi:hypothetical protein QZH41_017543 [Actinostola sp. cb2023]|nr:hypothetical protein QZH41_017543 [Actinostola sp. cb2023]